LVDQPALNALLSGQAVDVQPCDPALLHLVAGVHRATTTPGLATGIDIDRVVLDQLPTVDAAAPVDVAPTVVVSRTRTTRTATVSNCPSGCWLILGEGFNDGWQARAGSINLGAPRQISGGFNGWLLPPSASPVTVTMKWAPQKEMWIGMALAAIAVLVCGALIFADRKRAELAVADAPVPQWPPVPVNRRRALVAAAALVVLAYVSISPKYAVIAAIVGVGIVVVRRPMIAGVAALVLMSGLAALIVRRQLRYSLVANPSWPAAFDDLHRLGLLVVVLLLASTLVDECPDQQGEQVS
jgi:arabinofuranan 3-O-arabinosyltransferase